jgi:hypothetical protein
MEIEVDKILHFMVGSVIYIVGHFVTHHVLVSLLAVALAGLIKEQIDESRYGGFDPKDVVATFIGGCSAAIIIWVTT